MLAPPGRTYKSGQLVQGRAELRELCVAMKDPTALEAAINGASLVDISGRLCWTTSGVITAFDGKRTSTSATAAVSGDRRSQIATDEPSGKRAAI